MIDLETRLRRAARLLDETTTSGSADVVIALDDDSTDNLDGIRVPGSRARRRGLTIAGIAAAAAAVVGLVVVTGSGDEAAAPGTEPASSDAETSPGSIVADTTAPPDTTAVPDAPATMDQLRGHRWVAIEVDGEPWPLASLPYLEFGTQNTDSFIGGNDGCNSYGGFGWLAGDRLALDDVVSTAMACAETTAEVVPEDGDRLVLTGAGTRLELGAGGDSSARIVYQRLDSLGGFTMLSGGWSLGDDEFSAVGFGSETMVLGNCKGISYEFSSSRLRLHDIPVEASSACAPDSANPSFGRLADLLVSGPVEVYGDVDALYLSDDQAVMQLANVDRPEPMVTEPPTVDTGQVTDPRSVDTGAPTGEPGLEITVPGPETKAPLDTVAPDTVRPGVTEPTTPPTDPPANLEEALDGLGFDIDAIPAMVLGDAPNEAFCGRDDIGLDGDEAPTAGRCLMQHFRDGTAAVAVSHFNLYDAGETWVHRVADDGSVQAFLYVSDVYASSDDGWYERSDCLDLEIDRRLQCVGSSNATRPIENVDSSTD